MNREIEIYRQSFGIDTEFENLLFKIKPETLKIKGETVSQLFLLPCSIIKDKTAYPCKYLFAAATLECERKKGYMERLLKSILANETLILRPASQSLISYYKKFGFTEFGANDRDSNFYIKPTDAFVPLCTEENKTTEGDFTLMTLNAPFDLTGISFKFTLP